MKTTVVQPASPSRRAAAPGTAVVALALLALVLAIQGYAYCRFLPLSLGPRVVLQPWLIATQGFLTYDHIADQHTPLMPDLIALVVPFYAEGWRAARDVLVGLLSLTTLLAYAAGRRAAGWRAGLVAACGIACWSAAFGMTKLWHESFLAPLYVGLVLLHARPVERGDGPEPRRQVVLAGLLCGAGVLVKQHAVLVGAALVAWYGWRGWMRRERVAAVAARLLVFATASAATVLGGVAVHWLRGGSLTAWWYWVVRFSGEVGFVKLAALPPTAEQLLPLAPACVFLPAAVWWSVRGADRAQRPADGADARPLHAFGLLVALAASMTVYPRFAAFHLAAALPVVAWLAGVAAASGLESTRKLVRVATAMALIAWLGLGLHASAAAGAASPRHAIAEYSDLVEPAGQIEHVIGPSATVYVFPDDESTANLYYLLGKAPPRFWVFTYPWYMTAGTERRVLRLLEQRPPDWVIRPSTGWGHYAPEVFAWVSLHYEPRNSVPWAGRSLELLQRRAVSR
jgi:hypothetical protein